MSDEKKEVKHRSIIRESLTWPKKVTEEKYPWKEWFDGHVWRLKQGEDFEVDMRSFRAAIYMAADRYEYKVKTHIPRKKDCIFIQKIGKKDGN